ncbi:MAG: hypothetical protein WC807_13820 [Hyphomicrobium sp.]|jgi:hypothetical protein
MDKSTIKREIENRIKVHLRRNPDNPNVHLLWKGYVAALLEWGLISGANHDELRDSLDSVGDDEVREIFLGFPDEDE